MKQRVIGWGNPLAGEDGIGPHAADLVAARPGHDADVISTSCAPIRLVESMRGFARVVVADVRVDSADETIHRTVIRPSSLPPCAAMLRHDGTLLESLQSLLSLEDDRLPQEIVLLTAPTSGASEWNAVLSAEAVRMSEQLADAVCRELEVRAVG